LGHTQLPEDKYHVIDKQQVSVGHLKGDGLILDIGGGGEGIIGRLAGSRVIAIDNRKGELEEAPEGPLKIVMDASRLNFMDNTFGLVTAFFSFMYIPRTLCERVFQECHRVMKPDGDFLIWDVAIPLRSDDAKEIFLMPIKVILPEEEVDTAYGAPWKERRQDSRYFVDLADRSGFTVMSQWEKNSIFHLHLRRA
jgi:ubiquinone/menaquinone biosynthesis C-methylase UbiE